jgi:7-cyano-7-deazaguanosine (preQ0) biosynthesis protein QueE
MKVSEIFFSIQGEGLDIGRPAIFIRLAGCNLRCAWCDTKHALAADNGTEMSVDEIIALVQNEEASGCDYVVLTGGEPLMQDCMALAKALTEKRYALAAETNGTFFKPELLEYVSLWAVSPKLSSSGMRYNGNIIRKYAALPNAFFKFVITNDVDFEEARDLAKKYDLEKIVLQSEGSRGVKGYRWLIEKMKKESAAFANINVRVLPQLQLFARIK